MEPEENQTLEDELREIVDEQLDKKTFSVDFPDVQKVEVLNQPETEVHIDLSSVSEALQSILSQLKVKDEPIDISGLESKLQGILDAVSREVEDKEDIDYSDVLSAIKDSIPQSLDLDEFFERLEKTLESRLDITGGFKDALRGFTSSNWLPVVDAINKRTGDYRQDTSAASALNNGENYTTGWIDTDGYAGIKVAFKTDQDGYYTLEYSSDATNTDSTLTRYYRTAQIEPPHKFENMRRYVKVTFYNNSGSNQTYLRPDISLTNSAYMLNIPADATMSQDYDAISVRPTDFTSEVALGRRQGWTTWNKFGYNTDIDTTTDPEIVASWGGTFAYITTGETLDIVSSSTADDGDPAGTGAQQIIIYGVDENWNPQTEIVTMNGQTTVTTTSQWIGINRVAIYLAGSGKSNAGTIDVTGTSTSTQLAQMPVGQGTSQQLIFYVPANHQFLATWLVLNALKEGPASAPIVTFKGWVYSAVANAEYEVYRGSEDTNATTDLILNPPEPFIIGEKSIFWITAETTQNDTTVRGRFSGKLVRDVDA